MFCLYDQLMAKLRREDQQSYIDFIRMPPEIFDEILERVGPRITKQYTTYRVPLDPGMKLAVTLRHLASGSKYSNMQFVWRTPHNTISVIVREVCRAMVDEYVDEVMPLPTTAADWTHISDGFLEKWNLPYTLGALDGKHIACKCPPSSGSTDRGEVDIGAFLHPLALPFSAFVDFAVGIFVKLQQAQWAETIVPEQKKYWTL